MQSSIDLDDFIKQNQIGKGSFGKVYLVKEKRTGNIYAAKISLNDVNYQLNKIPIDIIREVNIISKFNHSSILKFKGYSPVDFKKNPRPVILTEYASNGSLENLIQYEKKSNTNFKFTDTRKLIIIYGIASGMAYLHSNDIINRDLKPANILIDEFLIPKIAAFGFSKVKHSNFESMTIDKSFTSIKGTPIYISPEIWKKHEYGKASDVYSFAFIVYEILMNEKPFLNDNLLSILLKVSQKFDE